MKVNLRAILFIFALFVICIDINAAFNPDVNNNEELCLCPNGMSGPVFNRTMETVSCSCSGTKSLISKVCSCDQRVLSSSWDESGCVGYTKVNTTLGSCSGEYPLGNSQNYNLTCSGQVRSSGTDYDNCYKNYQESAACTSLGSGYTSGTATRTCTKYYYKSVTCGGYNYSSCTGKCQAGMEIYESSVSGCDYKTNTCCKNGLWSGYEKKCPVSSDCTSSQCWNSLNGTCDDKPSSCVVLGGSCTYYCSSGWQKRVTCNEGCTYNIAKDQCLNSSGKPLCLSRCDIKEASACTGCGWDWDSVRCICICAGIWNGSACASSSTGQILCK